MSSIHEEAVSHDLEKGPSDRSFGLTVGGVLVGLAGIRTVWAGELSTLSLVLFVFGLPLVACALIAPRILAIPNRAWMRLSVLLSQLVNPVIMFLVFSFTVVPTGMVRRLLGRDSLGLRADPGSSTYWHERSTESANPNHMKNQF